MDFWIANSPNVHFYTSLPLVGEHYITGDSPVLVILMNDNPIWVPTCVPTKGITDVAEILKNPKYGFLVTLSPYVCALIHGQGGDGAVQLPPRRAKSLHSLGTGTLLSVYPILALLTP